jgi:hypothetical protein
VRAAASARLALAALLFSSAAALQAEARWTIQYFYDRADEVFNIRDIQCPSAERCIAAGVIEDKDGHQKGATVLTSDGGKHWSLAEVRERPVSLFLRSESGRPRRAGDRGRSWRA